LKPIPQTFLATGRWLLLLCLIFQAATARAEQPIVAIGFHTVVMRDFSRKDVEVSLRFWVEELSRSVNVGFRPVRFYDDLEEMKRDMDAGVINFMVASAMGIVQHFPPETLSDGFAGYKSVADHLLLVVRRDAGIRGPADLAGKRVVLPEGDDLTDIYLDTLLMKAWGKPDRSRLGIITRVERSSKMAHRLFFDQADAALINRSSYEAAAALNPQLNQRLTVLEDYSFRCRSAHIGLFSATLSPEHRERITQAALRLNDTARGRQVLQIYQADALVRTSVGDLIPFRELLEAHHTLLARAGRRPAGKNR
jgi:hypothetical protein